MFVLSFFFWVFCPMIFREEKKKKDKKKTHTQNRHVPGYSRQETSEFSALLIRLRHAFRDGDLAAIGAVATRSAEMNQRVLPKRTLGTMIGVAAAVGAAGVVAAHSGTCLALMIDALDGERDDRIQAATERLRSLGLHPTTFATLHSDVRSEPAHV